MEIIATQKFLLISPRKIRPIAYLIKKMKPQEAIDNLPFTGKSGALPMIKVIKSALASANQKGISREDLIFKEIQINEGPRLKRGRPVSRGQWHAIKRRMSHIRVVLTTAENPKVLNPKSETNLKLKKIETKKKGDKNGTEN